jgi:hypothetical protein
VAHKQGHGAACASSSQMLKFSSSLCLTVIHTVHSHALQLLPGRVTACLEKCEHLFHTGTCLTCSQITYFKCYNLSSLRERSVLKLSLNLGACVVRERSRKRHSIWYFLNFLYRVLHNIRFLCLS